MAALMDEHHSTLLDPRFGALASARHETRRLALPLVTANLFVPLMGMVDVGVVGHLPETTDMAAAALAGQFVLTLWFLFGFLRMGTTALAAQATGAGDRTALDATLVRALASAIVLGTGLILALPAWRALGWAIFGTEGVIRQSFQDFMSIRLIGAPAALGQFAVTGWLLGRQDARGPMLAAMVANLLNAALAIGFVFGLGLGLHAVAAATTLAEYGGLVVALVLAARHGLPDRASVMASLRDRAALARLFQVNRDLFLRSCLLQAAFVIFTALATLQGPAFVAANAILMTFFTATAWLLDGFAQACEALVGKAAGARSSLALAASVRAAFEYAGGLALVVTLVLALTGPWLIGVMTIHPEVRQSGLDHLWFTVALPLVSIWAFVFDGVFFGTARTAWLRDGMVVALAMFLAAAAILVPSMGSYGLWLSFLVFLAARGLVLLLVYRHLGGARTLAQPVASG